VLWGGEARVKKKTRLLGDLWELDGERWERRKVKGPAPSARMAAAMCWGGEGVLLHGGWDGERILDDLWLWDGEAWHERRPAVAPSARRWHAMAWDAAREQVVLFGGGLERGRDGETWIYSPNER